MSQATLQKVQFGEVLDLVDTLTVEEQEMLLGIVQSRLREWKRQALVDQVAEAEEEYRQGNYRTGTVEEFMAEVDR